MIRRKFITFFRGAGAWPLAAQAPPAKILRVALVAVIALLAAPLMVEGQQPNKKVPRIGLLAWASCDDPLSQDGEFWSFARGLHDFGYKPGDTITLECRSAGGRYDGLTAAAAELVRLSVDVIVTDSQPAGTAARNATATVPIVTVISGDPVAAGLARSIAKPGGNVTGVSYYATELTAKRLQLLKELLPSVDTVGVLANPNVSYLPFEEDTKRAAALVGVTTNVQQVSEAGDLTGAFARISAEGGQAVFVLPDVMFAWEAPRIAALALEFHLPTMAWGVWFTQSGCLMAYSAHYDEMQHRLAFYVDRILRGAKPGDLPIEQPTSFGLSLNLKTARALQLHVPPELLARADKVIE
jgi:putative tryptophan/tyrosine transport system substrate-binding protein